MTLAAIAGSFAMADDSNWYVGGNVGQSRARIDDTRVVDGLLEAGIDTTALKDDNRHFGFKAFGGYQFNRYFALEAGYFDLGKFGYTATTVPPAGMTGLSKINGGNVDAVGILPLSGRFSVFARIGYDYVYANDTFAGYGAVVAQVPERSEHSNNYKYGAGLQFAVNKYVGLRAEAERYRVKDGIGNRGDIDLFTAGVVFRFGYAAPPPPVAAAPVAVPEPVPAEPPPPPPPPPPPIRKSVKFSADSLFDFGKATIKPSGKRALDDFALELKGGQFGTIRVTGHTDRLGSHDYNMKLSARRADAVKAYLIETARIAESQVTARGVDGADPVTKPDDCKGERRTPALIACLQPDRRVDVEVTGTEMQAAPASQ
jgi:OOP family OmpA-OmpF porin